MFSSNGYAGNLKKFFYDPKQVIVITRARLQQATGKLDAVKRVRYL